MLIFQLNSLFIYLTIYLKIFYLLILIRVAEHLAWLPHSTKSGQNPFWKLTETEKEKERIKKSKRFLNKLNKKAEKLIA
jgi:hypothetical protein